jgi:hypothetical protein
MNSLAPIRSKLAKVVAMLSSDNDGDRRNAWRALTHMLVDADGTFVDLAMLIDPNFGKKNWIEATICDEKYSEAEVQQVYRAAFAEGQQSVEPQAPHQINWYKIADVFMKYIDDLNDRERDFVESIAFRIRVNYPLTEKQEKWAKDIYVKLGRRHGFTI